MYGCLSIGSVATYIGIPQLISDIAVPLLEGRTNTFYLGFVYWFTVLFNLVMTPMAMMTAFSVPLTQIALDMGMTTAFPTLFTMNAGAYNLFLPYEAVLVAGMYQGFGNTKLGEISCGIPIYVATEPMLKQPATKTTIGKFTVIKSSLVATLKMGFIFTL